MAEPPRVKVGTFRVETGRTTRVHHRPTPGAVEARVLGADAEGTWLLRVTPTGAAQASIEATLRAGEKGLEATVAPLEPGYYEVAVVADGTIVARRTAIVGYGSTWVLLTVK